MNILNNVENVMKLAILALVKDMIIVYHVQEYFIT